MTDPIVETRIVYPGALSSSTRIGSPDKKLVTFAMVGDGTAYTSGIDVGQIFIQGSSEVFVNGVAWILKETVTESTDIWQYEEVAVAGNYRQIKPRAGYLIYLNVPVIIKFQPQ